MHDEWDKQTALQKAARFCAYQERSVREVQDKLSSRISDPKIIQEILERLINEGFISEERFLDAFIKGRFFTKRWGKTKIVHALKFHDITADKVNDRMDQLISGEDYKSAAVELMKKKAGGLKHLSPLEVKGKVFRHMAGKGYEQDIIYEAWNELGFNV